MGGVCVCGAGSALCNGACVNLSSDTNHCGACGAACRTGQACVTRSGRTACECTNGQIECGGQCVPPLSDAFNCGGCGIRCGGGASCVAGVCQCTGTGQALCGGNCVAVGQSCSAGVGGCRRSGVTACLLGFVQCNAVPGTPLTEVCNNVDDDCDGVVDNSNAEDSCVPVPFKTATCVSGACAYQCFAGRGDCDGMLANGCETSLLDDPRNCNRCGVSCGNGVCLAGACVPCATGQTMCSNACTNLRDDPSNCGACGTRCGLGEFCDGGSCRPTGSTGADGGLIDGGSSSRDGGSDFLG
jgi:hypothetical protein